MTYEPTDDELITLAAVNVAEELAAAPPTGDRERPEDVLRDFLLWFYAEDHTRTDLDDPLAALDALVAERDRHKANAEDYHLALKARDRALAAERVRREGLAEALGHTEARLVQHHDAGKMEAVLRRMGRCEVCSEYDRLNPRAALRATQGGTDG